VCAGSLSYKNADESTVQLYALGNFLLQYSCTAVQLYSCRAIYIFQSGLHGHHTKHQAPRASHYSAALDHTITARALQAKAAFSLQPPPDNNGRQGHDGQRDAVEPE
jgi:hypothetical protein